MAGFGLLGGDEGAGDPLDLYGDLFTDKQRQALRQRELSSGLLRFAEKLGAASAPSRAPKGSFLGLLGQSLGGFAGGDEAAERQLKAMQLGEQVRASKQKRELAAKVVPFFWKVAGNIVQGTSDTPPAPGAVPLGPAPSAAPAGPGAPAGQPPSATAADAAAAVPAPPGAPPGPMPDSDELSRVSPWAVGIPQQDLSRFGIPMRPTIGQTGVPGQQTSLLPPPPGVPNPQMGVPGGVLSASLYNGGTPGGGFPFSGGGSPPGTAGPDLQQLASLMQEDAGGGGDDAPRGKGGYTMPMLKELARSVGFQGRDADIMAATWMGESSGNPWAKNVTNKEASYGLAQINARAHPGGEQAYGDPNYSARKSYELYQANKARGGSGFKDWTVYNTGAYKQYLGEGGGTQMAGGGRPDLSNMAGDAGGGGDAGEGGKIPGLNMTPQQLGAFNALFEMSGLGDPFKSLLDTYYKSPDYLGNVKRQSESIETEFAGKKAAAAAAATQKYIQENETHKSALDLANGLIGKGVYLDRTTNTMKPITNAAEALAAIDIAKERAKAEGELTDTTLTFPGESQPRTLQMTRTQARAVAEGRGVPELGIPAMTGIKLGKPVESPEQLKQQEIDQKFLEEKRAQAESSRRAIMAANDTRSLIEKGVVAGAYSDERTRLLKLGQLLNLTGKDDNDRIKQTEAYIANLGRGMKEGLKGLGPPVSNVDIQIAEKIAGGQNLTTQGMLELLKLEEKYHRLALQDYDKLYKSAPKSRYDKSVKEPPTFGAPVADDPNGVAHWWDGKAWRPL